MVPDLMPFAINTRGQVREPVCLESYEEKRGWRLFFFQDIQNFRGPIRVGAIIKGERHFICVGTVAANSIRLGQRIEDFVGNQACVGVDCNGPLSVIRARFNAEDLTASLHVHVLPGRDIL